MQQKISIIIVVYNGAATISHAIDSVMAQTYKELELIVVDGGSTDGTIEILQNYSHSNLFWKSEPDKGVYDAMNKGIQKASSEWIYFLGCDDSFYNKDVLENIFEERKYENADFIYGNVWKSGSKYDGEFDKKKIVEINICHQGIFYRNSIHERIGGYNLNYKIFADWDFNLRCFFNDSVRIQYVDIIISNFAEGGISAGKDDYAFFRNSLFSYSLLQLKQTGLSSLWNIARYDRWWRLIRSMKLTDAKDDIRQYTSKNNLPSVIQKMYSFQKRIPYPLIKKGVISKTAMLLSYCFIMPFSKLKE
jgi:glycosyltransferase involved in cell wall biosynthesis